MYYFYLELVLWIKEREQSEKGRPIEEKEERGLKYYFK
jgi:hypothetical protein